MAYGSCKPDPAPPPAPTLTDANIVAILDGANLIDTAHSGRERKGRSATWPGALC